VDLWPLALAGTGAAVLVGSVAGARHDHIPEPEQRVFRAINGLPGQLFPPVWVVMQFGNLVVGTVVGLALAAWYRHVGVALAVVAVVVLKAVSERVVRERIEQFLVVRQRPGTSEPGAVRRGRDVPVAGPSFPSGHAILAGALACIAATILPGGWVWLPFALALVVVTGRVYVGAHNPLDVTAGLGLGLLVGGGLGLLLR
jgi:membrane-associated phospholipid phosphatase